MGFVGGYSVLLRSLILFIFFSVILIAPVGAQVILNEYVSSNVTGLVDEDGESSDWIELYNAGTSTVDLTGYHLSDEVSDPFKWTFPAITIGAYQHLLVFASGKDRTELLGHWETIVDQGQTWRYRVNTSSPPSSWREPSFNDITWSLGATGIGFGDGDDATVVADCMSVSMRRIFGVSDPSAVEQLLLHVDYDDGFVAWLNGDEITRANIISVGNPYWSQPATVEHEAQIYAGRWPELFAIDLQSYPLQTGSNVLAIEVHNHETIAVDMTMIPFLTCGMAVEPPGAQGPSPVLRQVLPHLHTTFKLDANGEVLSLVAPGGTLIDQIGTGEMFADISRGRAPDGSSEWLLFVLPTPEAANGEIGFEDFATMPVFAEPGGYFTGPVSVTISSPDPYATIYYTLDASEPTISSTPHTVPISITETSVLRARAYAPGRYPSRIATHSYILNDPTTLPISSLVTDPPNLWDSEQGIFHDDNCWEDWERPLHVEFFEVDGTPRFSQDVGVKVFGGYSRVFPQKSMRLIARGEYGDSDFDCDLFTDRPYDSFKQLVWRNSGNDWCQSMLRDGLMHQLLAHTELGRLAFRPSRVYLNGDYWGIANIRERLDDHYLSSLFGVDGEAVDLVKNYIEIMAGSAEHYQDMLTYIDAYGTSGASEYAYIQTQMDTDNFAEYEIFEIFYANTDWPGNNIACWRPQTPDGRWRWVVYDTDFGLGLMTNYFHDTLAHALEPDGEEWPNPPHSTFLLRNLMENATFKRKFINSYCDHLNTSFLPARTVPIARQMAAVITGEIDRHQLKWGYSPTQWDQQIAVIEEFLQLRPVNARYHLRQQFSIPGDWTLTLDITPANSGQIDLTAISVAEAWSGTYCLGVPVELTAVPAVGYEFSGWSDVSLPTQPSVVIDPGENYAVTAIFIEIPEWSQAVINEINYNSAAGFDPGDWVELYNPGTVALDLGGWTFKDGNDAHAFVIPGGTTLAAEGYLVLCTSSTAFAACFPTVTDYIGDTGFGLSGSGEAVRLFDTASVLADSVLYSDNSPWPSEPDGNGPTLELIDPLSDNTLGANWNASTGYGTPAAINSSTTAVEPVLPRPLTLNNPYPNPFNPWTEISYSLDRRREVTLNVYDICGRHVRTLVDRVQEPGAHRVTWFGRDDERRPLASGIYLVRLQADDFMSSRKLTLLK